MVSNPTSQISFISVFPKKNPLNFPYLIALSVVILDSNCLKQLHMQNTLFARKTKKRQSTQSIRLCLILTFRPSNLIQRQIQIVCTYTCMWLWGRLNYQEFQSLCMITVLYSYCVANPKKKVPIVTPELLTNCIR